MSFTFKKDIEPCKFQEEGNLVDLACCFSGDHFGSKGANNVDKACISSEHSL